jgi:spermidine synthase
VNLVVGTVFVLNPLRHEVAKDEPIEPIRHNFPIRAVYLFTLVTGTITLSLEVLFVRVLGLTIGSGPHNFAIVVGVFILGLAIGSLLLTGRLLTVRVLFRAITILALYLMVLFHTVPYWPYWLSNARVAMRSLPVNYTVYLLLVTGFLALVLLPFLIPLGTMLPLVYGLIPGTDYGKKCGWMYFYNTLGTALGAILLSYLCLYLLDLDQVFKLDVALLVALAVYLFLREKRRGLAAVVTLAAVVFLAGPGWDRASHYVGLFRSPEVAEFNFQGWFQKPSLAPEVVSFEDGPDSTVAVVEYFYGTHYLPDEKGQPQPTAVTSRSLAINGNSDGDTLSDYSTNTLAGLLPYLYAPDREDLQATVVGLGTGLTAGTLGLAEDVAQVTVVEISSTLVESSPAFDEGNFGLSTNPKVEMLATDGFKYFNRVDDSLDIIVSATSPAWVVGVENLLTPEFYRLVHGALKDDGVFLQWFPLYTMNDTQFRTILSNLLEVFPHRRLYRISFTEMGILAAKSPLDELKTERFFEPALERARNGMQLDDPDQLALITLFETDDLDFVAGSGESLTHTLAKPSLAYVSDRIRFVLPGVDWNRFVDPRLTRLTLYNETRREDFDSMLARYPRGQRCLRPTTGPRIFCTRYQALWEAQARYVSPLGSIPLRLHVESYDALRQEGVQPIDREFLDRAVQLVVERMPVDPQGMASGLESILGVFANDGMWDEAAQTLTLMHERGLISPDYHERMQNQLAGRQRAREAFVNSYRGG